jgi:hypothetical protein
MFQILPAVFSFGKIRGRPTLYKMNNSRRRISSVGATKIRRSAAATEEQALRVLVSPSELPPGFLEHLRDLRMRVADLRKRADAISKAA